jgi:thiamine pyrophosphate-dependent acetolactate synthase large subunit-like protein
MQIAQSGTPGPVFVEFPIDTLYPYPLVKKETGLKVRKLAKKTWHSIASQFAAKISSCRNVPFT